MGQQISLSSCCLPWVSLGRTTSRHASELPVRPANITWYGRKRVLCFGDSLTAGLCCGTSRSLQEYAPYSRRLEERLNAGYGDALGKVPSVITAGVSGQTTGEMLPRLPSLLYRGDKFGERDVVLILGGTNDMGAGTCVNDEDIFLNLKKLHQKVHKHGSVSVAMTIPQMRRGSSGAKITSVNRMLEAFAAQTGSQCVVCDVAKAFPHDDKHAGLWEKDGVHLTERGYSALGDLLADVQLPPITVADG